MTLVHARLAARFFCAACLLATPAAPAAEIPGITPGEAEVGFDIPLVLTCHDVTTQAFASNHPGERLVEVRAPISLLLYRGEPERLRDVVIEIDGGESGLRVHDYGPRTQLASDHAKPISEQRTVAEDKTLGASVGGKLSGDLAISPSISGGYSKSETRTSTTHKLPPKEAVLVSGTTNSRRGVYFKLRRTDQSTLEGEHEFCVTFIAPEDWPGGVVEVRCVARGKQKWLMVEQRRVWNETTAPVELRLVSHAERLESEGCGPGDGAAEPALLVSHRVAKPIDGEASPEDSSDIVADE